MKWVYKLILFLCLCISLYCGFQFVMLKNEITQKSVHINDSYKLLRVNLKSCTNTAKYNHIKVEVDKIVDVQADVLEMIAKVKFYNYFRYKDQILVKLDYMDKRITELNNEFN